MNDAQLQNSLARVMLTGVLVAAAVMGAGLIWFVVTHDGMPTGDHVFRGEPKYLKTQCRCFREPWIAIMSAIAAA